MTGQHDLSSHVVGKAICGARTRRGTDCTRKGLANGRCRNHGGLSTGPRSPQYRAQLAQRMREHWALWRIEKSKCKATNTRGDR
jgi:hypothetical protein